MKTIQANALSVLLLGKQGEHLARRIVFDLSEWADEYGAGMAELIYQRPGDTEPYPIATIQENNDLIWTLTAVDTEKSGDYGKCEVRYYVGTTVVKSETWRTWVDTAMNTNVGAVPPESEKGWVEQVLQAGISAKAAASRAEEAAIHQPYPNSETGTWWVWDAESKEYKDSGEAYSSNGNNAFVGISAIQALDRAEYDALIEKSATTLYIIRG